MSTENIPNRFTRGNQYQKSLPAGEGWDHWVLSRTAWHGGLLAETPIPADDIEVMARKAVDLEPDGGNYRNRFQVILVLGAAS